MSKRSSKDMTYKMTLTAFLTALGVVFHYVESFIPMFIPGFKLGLANVVSMFALFYLGPSYYVSVTVLRILLSALFTGFGTNFLLSLGGGLLSMVFSLLMYFFTRSSVYGVSVVSAFFHVLGQILVYIWIVDTPYMLLYFPILAVLSMSSGFILAILIAMIIRALPKAGTMTRIKESDKDQKKGD